MFLPTSRRSFLKGSLSSSALIALSGAVPKFLLGAAASTAEVKGESVLVVIQLSGGNDGLNTVVPYADDVYRKSRPILGIPTSSVLKIDDYVGLHPSMDGFSKLLQQGRLGIVQGAGYPSPDRSHFSSMDIWQSGQRDVAKQPTGYRATGWLGRYLDAESGAVARRHHDVPALHLASGTPRLPLSLVGKDIRAGSFQSIEAFKLEDGGDPGIRRGISRAVEVPRENANDLVTFLHQGTASALESSRQVQEAVRAYKTDIKYPTSNLARRLQTIAQLIDAGLDTRIYYLDLDGFDTHANQAVSHAGLLAELSGAVSAFMADLDSHGHGKRVMAMTFSEFGRRLHENASRGTDHGAAAPMFIAGGKVKAGLIGKHPSLTDLDQEDLRFSVDFRCVYAGVLEQWLGVASEPILGGKFTPVQVV